MDPILHRHAAKYIYAVPEGLRELMSDISREVLRSQPKQLYTFIADYLDALLITRENARVAARLIEVINEISTTIVEFLLRAGLTRQEADRITTKIQTAFREHLAKKKHLKLVQESEEEEERFLEEVVEECELENMYLDAAARIIQKAYRQFKEREARERDLLRGMVDWRVAAKATINLYRRTGVTYAEANRAATLIKAAYKGYYTRRVMRRLLETGAREYAESLEEEEEEEAEQYQLPEAAGEDDWGWCYCFLEDKLSSPTTQVTVDTVHVVSEESDLDATAVIDDFMTRIIKEVIPSDEQLEPVEFEATPAEIKEPPAETLDDTQIVDQTQDDSVPVKAETEPGQAETEPGQAETEPGQAETEPKQIETEPEQVETEPGQVETEPGQVETEPGQVETETEHPEPGIAETIEPLVEKTESKEIPAEESPAPPEETTG